MLAGLALAFSSAGAFGQTFTDYTPLLGGTSNDYQWSNFVRPSGVSTGTAGTAGQWSQGIAPNNNSTSATFSAPVASDTTDFLDSNGGIYSFFSQTHFSVTDTAPVAGIQSVTFQLALDAGLTGTFGGTPVDLAVAPTLQLNLQGGGTQTLPATFSLLAGSISTVIPAFGNQPTTQDLLDYQWDLSGVSGTILSYSINWQTAFHSITQGMDLTESTSTHTNDILVAAVPEPSTYALMAFGIGAVWFYGRRKTSSSKTVQS